MNKAAGDSIEAQYVEEGMSTFDLDHPAWNAAQPAFVKNYWSGAEAPLARHAEARVLWSREALHVRFVGHQAEPLIINPTPKLDEKTIGLWERDVCEIFVAPDARELERYFEFEVAPTGEWLDLGIHQMPEARATAWEFRSGMTAWARIGEGEIAMAIRIPFTAFGIAPRAGQEWRANIFRCVGSGEERGYLAWRPTRTAQPSFHVPSAFGRLLFAD